MVDRVANRSPGQMTYSGSKARGGAKLRRDLEYRRVFVDTSVAGVATDHKSASIELTAARPKVVVDGAAAVPASNFGRGVVEDLV